MPIVFGLWWGLLIYGALRSRDVFLSTFVVTQFIFVGFGLLFFASVPAIYLDTTFPDFDFSRIDEYDFNYASIVILVGVTVSVMFYAALCGNTNRRTFHNPLRTSRITTSRLVIFAIIALAVCLYYIIENASSFFLLSLARQSDDLADAFELRQSATADYLITIMIYNFCPAVAITAIAWSAENRYSKMFDVMILMLTLLVAFALLMTFQKRPLLVFLFGLLLVCKVRRKFMMRQASPFAILKDFFLSSHKYFLLLFLILFGLYFFYTGFRFGESGFWSTFTSILEVVISRIIGRLSVPAAFYVDFFPGLHEHYWFNNVGLFANLLDKSVFRDTAAVFSSYSRFSMDGSVAASVFSDAFGQGGPFWVPIVGALVGILIFIMRQTFSRASPGSSKLLFMIFGMIYIYYLSQSSLFRASLGYGGLIWLIMWIFLVRNVSRGAMNNNPGDFVPR